MPLPADHPEHAIPPNHAFLFDHNVLHDLGTPVGKYSHARDINNLGQIVGGAAIAHRIQEPVTEFDTHHALLYDHGKWIDLGGQESAAYAINDRGQIVGTGWFDPPPDEDGHDHSHVAMFSPGAPPKDLGLFGGDTCFPRAINHAGDIIVEVSESSPDRGWGVLLRAGAAPETLTLGGINFIPSGLNDSDQVVGTADVPNESPHAFLFQDGKLYDLNSRIPAASLAANHLKTLTRADGINNLGQIVGTATTTDGHTRAFLLTPAGIK